MSRSRRSGTRPPPGAGRIPEGAEAPLTVHHRAFHHHPRKKPCGGQSKSKTKVNGASAPSGTSPAQRRGAPLVTAVADMCGHRRSGSPRSRRHRERKHTGPGTSRQGTRRSRGQAAETPRLDIPEPACLDRPADATEGIRTETGGLWLRRCSSPWRSRSRGARSVAASGSSPWRSRRPWCQVRGSRRARPLAAPNPRRQPVGGLRDGGSWRRHLRCCPR
jgi:hypothetical protein